jgi:hypothetical protein
MQAAWSGATLRVSPEFRGVLVGFLATLASREFSNFTGLQFNLVELRHRYRVTILIYPYPKSK